MDILRMLQQDNRKTSAELSAEIGLSVSAVNERVRKLNTNGTIAGNRAIVSPSALGTQVCAFVFIDLNGNVKTGTFTAAASKLAEIQELHHIAGQHDYLAKVRTADIDGLRDVLAILKAHPAVSRTETVVVLETRKETPAIALPQERVKRGKAFP